MGEMKKRERECQINFYLYYCVNIFVDIDSEFKKFLFELVPFLLQSKNLVVKKINGNIITGRGLLECFKVIWWRIINPSSHTLL